jgi:hypothetical protein
VWLALALVAPGALSAQIRIGALHGEVEDPSGGRVAGIRVEVLDQETGRARAAVTDRDGRFTVPSLPHGRYAVTIPATSGFGAFRADVTIDSNLPVRLVVALTIARLDDRQVVSGRADARPVSTRSETRVNDTLAILPPQRASSMAALLGAEAGVARAHNGLVHVRGVEDGMLYVVDGIPVTERYDALHASALDLDAVDSLTLITGNLPAEFGGRSGAVASIDHAPDPRRFGYAGGGAGSEASRDLTAGGGVLAGPVHLSASAVASASDRYLDPVDEGNFHNHGDRLGAGLRATWRASAASRLVLNAAAARTDLEVPNDALQHAAGQRQRQSLDDESLAIAWQRVATERTVTDAALFHRRYASHLSPSPFDLPISARSDRAHTRSGAVGSITHQRGRHLVKAGFDVSRIAPEESFSFAITDAALAEERDVSEPALAFDAARPFAFAGSRAGSYAAGYVQDEVAFGPSVRLDAGLRFERASLPRPAAQWSPRLGAAVALPRVGGVARASFNRLFMPPHVEHLLLASSEEARALSPFAGETAGGATVRPERVTAFEVGFAPDLGRLVSLDVAYWDRRFDDVADPNVFFNTTIVFPNSVAEGRARGVDVRLALRERRGISGFVNYTHARVTNVGPITGGLFLTDEFVEIGPGTAFHPDHDQPHVASAGVRVRPAGGRWWLALDARHGGGGPLEIEEDDLDEVLEGPGGDLIDAGRQRMRPWTVVDLGASVDVLRGRRGRLSLRADLHNLLGTRFAYTVGSPFEGTRFGHPRLARVGLRWRSPID